MHRTAQHHLCLTVSTKGNPVPFSISGERVKALELHVTRQIDGITIH